MSFWCPHISIPTGMKEETQRFSNKEAFTYYHYHFSYIKNFRMESKTTRANQMIININSLWIQPIFNFFVIIVIRIHRIFTWVAGPSRFFIHHHILLLTISIFFNSRNQGQVLILTLQFRNMNGFFTCIPQINQYFPQQTTGNL